MKKISICLVVAVILCMSITAQVLQKNEKGEYRLKENQNKWEDTEIKVSQEAVQYQNFFSQAIEKKGKKIVVETTQNQEMFVAMTGPVTATFASESKTIVFDGKAIVFDLEKKEESKVAFFIIFVFASIILMLLSGFLSLKNENGVGATFGAFVATFGAFVATAAGAAFAGAAFAATAFAATAFAATAFGTAAFAGATAAAFAAAFVAGGENKILLKIFSTIYFVCMIIFLIIIYTV